MREKGGYGNLMCCRGEMDYYDLHNENDKDKSRMMGRQRNNDLRLGLYI